MTSRLKILSGLTMASKLKFISGHLTNLRPHKTDNTHLKTAVLSNTHFKYTVDNCKLTFDQRRFYEENGFLVIKKLVPQQKLTQYNGRFVAICKGEVIVPGLSIMRDVAIKDSQFVSREETITKIHDFHEDNVLYGYCALPEIVEYVECFTGPNIVALNTLLINKPPDTGKLTSRHPLHQDLHYFPIRPVDRIVCSWTAMQTINRENGCMAVVPGSHKGELLVHEYPKWEGGVNILYHGIKNYDPNQNRVYLEMEEGDTVFFHPLLVHGSGANRSRSFRKAIACHYSSGDAYYVDVTNTMQQDVAEEILKTSNKFLEGRNISYQEFWKMRCRKIKGKDNLNAA